MYYSPSSTAGGVLCQGQWSESTNRDHAENNNQEFAEDRAANKERHRLTSLQLCMPLHLLLQV